MMITDDPKMAAGAIGIEVVTPGLVALLRANIDPQHGFHKPLACWDSALPMSAAGFVASKMPMLGFDDGPSEGSGYGELVLFIEKPDLDSLAAAALIVSRLDNEASRYLGVVGAMKRVQLIDELDCGLSGDLPWTFGSDFVDAGSHPQLRGLARIIADRRISLVERVGIMQRWLITGTHSLIEAASKEAEAEMEDGRRNAYVTTFALGPGGSVETIVEGPGHLAIVELDNNGKLSRGRGACAIGYRTAPVVIAVCEDFAGRNWTGRKYTVAVHPGAAMAGITFDFERFLNQIGGIEAGWGGNTKGPGGIVGSPLSGPSALPLRFVKQAALSSISLAVKKPEAGDVNVAADDPYQVLLAHDSWRQALVERRGEYVPRTEAYKHWDHELAAFERLVAFHRELIAKSEAEQVQEIVELLRQAPVAHHPTISEQFAKLIVSRYRLVQRT